MDRADHTVASRTSLVATRMRQAERLCRDQGLRLTPVHRDVYRVLLNATAPLTAYQLLDALNGDGAKRLYPQTVYRSLATLQRHGLVHRLESANAFLPCVAPARPHDCIHLLCQQCGGAEELVDAEINDRLSADARRAHFDIAQQVIELRGTCAACRKAGSH